MENINLIRKIAWSFHHSTGMDWDDLFQEAALAYLEGLESYDENKGAISTHMWHVISSRLKNYIKEEKTLNGHIIPSEEIEYTANDVYQLSFFEELSNEARTIAEIILATSGKFVCLTSAQVETRIQNILKQDGWSDKKIRAGIHDLMQACNN